jgi:hypothetical protein
MAHKIRSHPLELIDSIECSTGIDLTGRVIADQFNELSSTPDKT